MHPLAEVRGRAAASLALKVRAGLAAPAEVAAVEGGPGHLVAALGLEGADLPALLAVVGAVAGTAAGAAQL